MATEESDNLDHLQRQNKQQPRKRTAPVAPIGFQQLGQCGGGWPSPLPPSDTVDYSKGRTPWEIKVRFDMPGMTKEDVKVWVEEKMLVVKAEKVPKKKGQNQDENGEDWSANSDGRYSSRIALPENIEFENIKAEVLKMVSCILQ